MFAEIMTAGRRAAIAAPGDLAAAAAAVQIALAPMWPQVVPEAARDVLSTCAQLAVGRGVTALPPNRRQHHRRRHAPAHRLTHRGQHFL
jgi:hypothetical protein